jgi:polyhydroxyalkanoate synthase
VLTNPEVLRATLQSNGENLVKGLNNLLEDLDRGEGQLSIRQSADAFTIGENIATAPGKVVFRNELLELLQFEPTTAEVYEKPLLIFPPWINKFYILDLRPENSFIRWAWRRATRCSWRPGSIPTASSRRRPSKTICARAFSRRSMR